MTVVSAVAAPRAHGRFLTCPYPPSPPVARTLLSGTTVEKMARDCFTLSNALLILHLRDEIMLRGASLGDLENVSRSTRFVAMHFQILVKNKFVWL